jgi:hypothetical protein
MENLAYRIGYIIGTTIYCAVGVDGGLAMVIFFGIFTTIIL